MSKPSIIFWGNGDRALPCYEKLRREGYSILLAVLHPAAETKWHALIKDSVMKDGIEFIAPEDPNAPEVEDLLRRKKADLFVLAGYGKMLKRNIFSLPKILCLNLHGGHLPKYRGSSPLNWALINGEKQFGLSVLEVTEVVDGGRVLIEKQFPVGENDTIVDLHHTAAREFPLMLAEGLKMISESQHQLKTQDPAQASYYPLRFPNDGFVLFDQLSAEQLHNRIRALTQPYPCAFSFYNGRKVKLTASRHHSIPFYGEPGRVYQKNEKGLLICAQDRCLWITEAHFEDTGESLFDAVKRYDKLATLKDAALEGYLNKEFK